MLEKEDDGANYFLEGKQACYYKLREQSAKYVAFLDKFAPCVTGELVWNKNTNPFDRIVNTGAPLDDVFTESDEAFLIIAMKNNQTKWFI